MVYLDFFIVLIGAFLLFKNMFSATIIVSILLTFVVACIFCATLEWKFFRIVYTLIFGILSGSLLGYFGLKGFHALFHSNANWEINDSQLFFYVFYFMCIWICLALNYISIEKQYMNFVKENIFKKQTKQKVKKSSKVKNTTQVAPTIPEYTFDDNKEPEKYYPTFQDLYDTELEEPVKTTFSDGKPLPTGIDDL